MDSKELKYIASRFCPISQIGKVEKIDEGIINTTESFLRSGEVHRLFIQEKVQGTFAESTDYELRVNAVRK